MVRSVLVCCFLFFSAVGRSQNFPAPGQLANSAFPVCGTQTFVQTVVPKGIAGFVYAPGCGDYTVYNPFWYTFTCYQTGTLGFLLDPNNNLDDYDWMLFDITGRLPKDIYKDKSLVVAGNWAGTYGNTGASAAGSDSVACGSDPAEKVNTFSTMPTLLQHHKYLLLVSHYTDSQSGYQLSFSGGTAVLNNEALPHIVQAAVHCDRKSITLAINKDMRCASLATDGSDFSILAPGIQVLSATGLGCSVNFDLDSITLVLNAPLPYGDYQLMVRPGSDNNTLLDDCNNEIDSGEKITFSVLPPHSTPMDSVVTPTCAPQTLELVFKELMQCASIAPDGSDFTVTGPSAVGISQASGFCQDGLTYAVNITLTQPIATGGSYQIVLKSGSDGNTIMNECGLATPAGSALPFTLKDTVSAAFQYNILYGCINDSIAFTYPPANGVDQWNWTIDTNYHSTLPNPQVIYQVFGIKQVQLIVSNGFCSDTSAQTVNLDNFLQAGFTAPNQVCPKDAVTFTNTSIGNTSVRWNFGDGSSSTDAVPAAHIYPNTEREKIYPVSLVVRNDHGCADTLVENITRLQSCAITVPSGFTPDNDGKNDLLYPLNAFSTKALEFKVFNRLGQLIFESRDWRRKWDGTLNGRPQPMGTYIWTLQYIDGLTGKEYFQRGTSVLIR